MMLMIARSAERETASLVSPIDAAGRSAGRDMMMLSGTIVLGHWKTKAFWIAKELFPSEWREQDYGRGVREGCEEREEKILR